MEVDVDIEGLGCQRFGIVLFRQLEVTEGDDEAV
jgi:hypothetical protein